MRGCFFLCVFEWVSECVLTEYPEKDETTFVGTANLILTFLFQYLSNYLELKKFPTQVVIKAVPKVRYSQDFPILPPWDSQTLAREDSEIRQVIIQRIPFSLTEIR